MNLKIEPFAIISGCSSCVVYKDGIIYCACSYVKNYLTVKF